MPNKLKFYTNKEGKKIYTLKLLSPDGKPTQDAHYKFIKLRDAPKSSQQDNYKYQFSQKNK